MTPKQKAHQIYDQYWGAVSRGPVCKTDELPDMRPLLEQAIIDAIAEEREACAKICEEYATDYRAITERPGGSAAHYAVSAGNKLAYKLRARGRS